MNRIQRLFCLVSVVGISYCGFSQTKTVKDTITIMQYNLLNYGYNGNTCGGFNITLAHKDKQLKTLIDYIKPDILGVNEMGCNELYSRRILANCLNQGTSKFERTKLQKSGTQNICNSYFYNTEKLGLINSSAITKTKNAGNIIRAIDFLKLYVKGEYLSISDTISLSHLVVHLKASNGISERAEREKAAEGIMYHLEQNESAGNYILSGDFNVYKSSEGAYQQFTKYTKVPFRFYDPIKQEGSWNNNGAYAKVHTQATRTGSCGGMDDRFDFILVSKAIIDDSSHIKYIADSYRAVGQDGKRLNQSVISPTNTDVPADIATALYEMSDHLPIILKLEVTYEVPVGVESLESKKIKSRVISPSFAGIKFNTENQGEENPLKFQVFSIEGRLVKDGIVEIRTGVQEHNLEFSGQGIFILKLTSEAIMESQTHKVIVW